MGCVAVQHKLRREENHSSLTVAEKNHPPPPYWKGDYNEAAGIEMQPAGQWDNGAITEGGGPSRTASIESKCSKISAV
eukprot:m.197190 g.197190  ORF g.197190 m.197190 type:complete len:78 (-) comp20044_c0_seq1:150-383(-)